MANENIPQRVLQAIAEERARQITIEGFTEEHDDAHTDGALAKAAACYAAFSGMPEHTIEIEVHRINSVRPMPEPRESQLVVVNRMWPWDWRWWKPSQDRKRNLVRAAALIIAELERLERMEEK